MCQGTQLEKKQNLSISLWDSCALQEPGGSVVWSRNSFLGGVVRTAGYRGILDASFPF